jgi:F-type H+-transporting ATPase subunit delta
MIACAFQVQARYTTEDTMSMRASAARYARALLDVTISEGDPQQAERELAAFVDLLQQHRDLGAALTNPAVPAASKRAVIEQVLATLKPSGPITKTLLLLADRDRLSLLPDLLDIYRDRLLTHQQVVRAEVTTATPLAEERAADLQRRLAETTGRQVLMTTKVDPAIIGGVVTRIGSTVYDGSVASQLQAMRQRLANQF